MKSRILQNRRMVVFAGLVAVLTVSFVFDNFFGRVQAAWCFETPAMVRCFDDSQEDECRRQAGRACEQVSQPSTYGFLSDTDGFCRTDTLRDGNLQCYRDLKACEGGVMGFLTHDCQRLSPEGGLSSTFVSSSDSSFTADDRLPPPSFEYRPLERDLISQENAYLPNYLRFIFNLGIGIVGMSALVMLSIGGFTYITSAGNNANAETAKRIIRDALVGVIMAFFAWLLLYVINPDLVDIDANLAGLDARRMPPPTAGVTASGGSPRGGAAYQEMHESRVRGLLEAAGVQIWSSQRPPAGSGLTYVPCESPTQRGCTSVADLPDDSIRAITGLKEACGPSCRVIVTGGSEEGSHATHGPGKNIFDLEDTPELLNYIRSVSPPPNIGSFGGTENAEFYYPTEGPLAGARVVREDSHLHVILPDNRGGNQQPDAPSTVR